MTGYLKKVFEVELIGSGPQRFLFVSFSDDISLSPSGWTKNRLLL